LKTKLPQNIVIFDDCFPQILLTLQQAVHTVL